MQESQINTKDGVSLFVRDWPPASGMRRRGSLLLVHGLGEHCGRYAHVAARLNSLGLHVRGYDHRGFGRSEGARARVPYREALVDDLTLMFERLTADATAAGDGSPSFLLGHSMGGAIVARAATGGFLAPRGLILSSPALKTRLSGLLYALTAVSERIVPNMPSPHGLPLHRISHDPGEVAKALADPLNHPLITPRLAMFIAKAGPRAVEDAAGLKTPTLLLAAGDDRLVDVQGARDFAARAPAGSCTLKIYDGLYHEIFNELPEDRARVLDDLAAWLAAQLGA
jgi:alpha-beta hydrolase superfamily lysophospholipase